MRGVPYTVTESRMIEPRASVLQLATGLVEAQLARDASAWHVTSQLHASLARMVGANGFDVLLARAFVELLVVLIGEDLAMRLLRELQQHAKEPTR